MSDYAALARRITAAALAVLAVAGCAQPGTQAPRSEAAKLAVGTSDISAACGYREELTAFGAAKGKDLSSIKSMAQTGAQKLARVYAKDQTGIYQGDSIGGLHDCGLTDAEQTLKHALARHG